MSNQNNEKDPFINQIIFNKYKIIKPLGKGSFGSIYLVQYNNKFYAMKLENVKKGFFILEKEVYIMNYLYGPRIPYVKSFGQCGFYNVLVMETLGKSLEELRQYSPNKKMTIPCVCKLSYQMIQILEFIHKKNFLHRDIKPENFLMGVGANNKFLYVIDLGLSKTYRHPETLIHVQRTKGKGMTGTARFASINTLSKYTQSRRDDLESLGYVIIYLIKGTLPWNDIKSINKEELYDRILKAKTRIGYEILCQNLPQEFEEYFKYIKAMTFEQEPDYNYLKNLFLNALIKIGGKMDYIYDWDNRINDLNLEIPKINNTNPEQDNFVPNDEKIFNDDNTLKLNYNKQVEFALQNKIYKREEINESNIEPYPIDTFDLNELNMNKNDMTFNNNKKRIKEAGCECCIIL